MAHGPDTKELLQRIKNIVNGKLDVSSLNITSLPELPSSLRELNCYFTPLLINRNLSESIVDYNSRWNNWREIESKKRQQYLSKLIKEELVQTVWAPHRVEKWLEAGGFELLDSM